MPAPFFVRAILGRAFAFWAFVRLVVTAGSQAMQQPGLEDPLREAFRLTPPALLALVALVYGLVLLDARRRNNLVFLANMGVGRVAIGGLVVGPVLLAEFIVGMVL